MKKGRIRAGKQILDIITSGMYSNALMVLREYVQNATDAIDEAVKENYINYASSRIDIQVDGANRSICIMDNGAGVSCKQANEILASIGVSNKRNGSWRGFRGIGRLGGLGYCDKVIFETKSVYDKEVSIAVWDSKLLRSEYREVNSGEDLIDTIKKIVTRSTRQTDKREPRHFFKVTMQNIHRFHKDDLMNIEEINKYLSQVSPIPFDKHEFSFTNQIERHLTSINGYRTYNIYLNDSKLYKPHRNKFAISGEGQDSIKSVKMFEINNKENQCVGRGWFAQCNFKAALIPNELMRGIRVRQGNIEIGDNLYLADYFTERRFASWNIGEIHINYSLRLNARRDGFEHSSNYESFLEQAILICRYLSHLCRLASKSRSQEIYYSKSIANIEKNIEGYLFLQGSHRDRLFKKVTDLLDEANDKLKGDSSLLYRKKIRMLQEKIQKIRNKSYPLNKILDGRILRKMTRKELIEEMLRNIIENHNKVNSSTELVKALLCPYLNKNIKQYLIKTI